MNSNLYFAVFLFVVYLCFTTVNGSGNEATQLLRQMITCRSLGILPSTANIARGANIDQPLALLKVYLDRLTDVFFCI